jgi:hypothetical protein
LLRSNSWGECKPCTTQRGPTELCMLMDLQRRTIFSKTIFVKSQKYELGGGVRLKLKINILFCGDNSWSVALRQMKSRIVKDHGHTQKFYFNHFLTKSLNVEKVQYFEVILEKTLNHSVKNPEILYSAVS